MECWNDERSGRAIAAVAPFRDPFFDHSTIPMAREAPYVLLWSFDSFRSGRAALPRRQFDRQDRPVAEILIKRDEDSMVLDSTPQDLRIVRSSEPHVRVPLNVMTVTSQRLSHIDADHLVEVQTHQTLHGIGRQFGMLDGRSCVKQRCCDVLFAKLRQCAPHLTPRFAGGQMVKDHRYGYSCAADHGLPAAYARIDLDSVCHTVTLLPWLSDAKDSAAPRHRQGDTRQHGPSRRVKYV